MQTDRNMQPAAAPPNLAPVEMPTGGGTSLVDATYAAAPAPGAVIPISRSDPDGRYGRSVTQEVLALPHRGEAMVRALYATGLPPIEIGRDVRNALAQGVELIQRILATSGHFDLSVLDPMLGVWGFDTLMHALRDRNQRGSGVDSSENASGGDTSHAIALTVMGKLAEQFPESANEAKVREYDHAYRIVGNQQGTQVTGDRGSDLFVVDASFTGDMVIDGGNVTRVENRIHFDGPPRWVGPYKQPHRYSFYMAKIDDAGRIIATIRSIHNHGLEGTGLIFTDNQKIDLFEVPQTGLNIHDILGVLAPVIALIPGGQLAAAVLRFADVGIRIAETGDLGGNIFPLIVASTGVVSNFATSLGAPEVANVANRVGSFAGGVGGVITAGQTGDPLALLQGGSSIGVATGVVPPGLGNAISVGAGGARDVITGLQTGDVLQVGQGGAALAGATGLVPPGTAGTLSAGFGVAGGVRDLTTGRPVAGAVVGDLVTLVDAFTGEPVAPHEPHEPSPSRASDFNGGVPLDFTQPAQPTDPRIGNTAFPPGPTSITYDPTRPLPVLAFPTPDSDQPVISVDQPVVPIPRVDQPMASALVVPAGSSSAVSRLSGVTGPGVEPLPELISPGDLRFTQPPADSVQLRSPEDSQASPSVSPALVVEQLLGERARIGEVEPAGVVEVPGANPLDEHESAGGMFGHEVDEHSPHDDLGGLEFAAGMADMPDLESTILDVPGTDSRNDGESADGVFGHEMDEHSPHESDLGSLTPPAVTAGMLDPESGNYSDGLVANRDLLAGLPSPENLLSYPPAELLRIGAFDEMPFRLQATPGIPAAYLNSVAGRIPIRGTRTVILVENSARAGASIGLWLVYSGRSDVVDALDFSKAGVSDEFIQGLRQAQKATKIANTMTDVQSFMDFLGSVSPLAAAVRARVSQRRGTRPTIAQVRRVNSRFGVGVTQAACFAAGTLVATPHGPVPIEALAEGDLVLSRAAEGGEVSARPIAAVFVRPGKEVFELTSCRDGAVDTLVVTAGHPFYVTGRGWVDSEQLGPGDELVAADGSVCIVESLRHRGEITTVHNLEVRDLHTYFVGEHAVWVHNETRCDLVERFRARYPIGGRVDAAKIKDYKQRNKTNHITLNEQFRDNKPINAQLENSRFDDSKDVAKGLPREVSRFPTGTRIPLADGSDVSKYTYANSLGHTEFSTVREIWERYQVSQAHPELGLVRPGDVFRMTSTNPDPKLIRPPCNSCQQAMRDAAKLMPDIKIEYRWVDANGKPHVWTPSDRGIDYKATTDNGNVPVYRP
jgi:hypothetical protein